MEEYYIILTDTGQTIEDVAIQEYGGVEGIWDVIEDNPGVCDTPDVELEPGTPLNFKIAGSVRTDAATQAYYRSFTGTAKILVNTGEAPAPIGGSFDDSFDDSFDGD